MRQVAKGAQPDELRVWKAANRALPNYCYAALSAAQRLAIRISLIGEQRGLCAYTGRRIEDGSCHIEHLVPQAHCQRGEDVDYRNIVACVPAPNAARLTYGAHRKGDWPSISDRHLFVSPLKAGCASRFVFHLNGEVEGADAAAGETVTRLGLNEPILVHMRKQAIDATLRARGGGPASLPLADARRRMRGLAQAEQQAGVLEPFSFVLMQALEKHIRRVEARQAARGRA